MATDFCVGPLVPSTNPNPISEIGDDRLVGCGLACDSGFAVYGLSENQQSAIDWCTIIGTSLSLIGIIFLSVNLYFDAKSSKGKLLSKPILFHIPYAISLATFTISLSMSISRIIGQSSIVCLENREFSFWNYRDGKNIGCTIFSFFF